MEKTYFIATLAFGWFITLGLGVFTYFGFRLGYPLIGIMFIAITIASAAMNILLIKKWKRTF
ncbi:hypothetical protein [Lederbergia lenta]|uniref:Uncharacterized protein n=1 Tax=Lederbergia lenta TaxID=1467 RepID=A0A2X4WI69_LEDLE|nr:hypothetical protein [Lederbergia lenta]MCM3109720.1 hypothetical protein [Lederbergia lenta]MEC2324529.1 hypothetical protein [Lederbergia lenta]SQI59578.1 Uncharacterised protein [Lederbergia lenta]